MCRGFCKETQKAPPNYYAVVQGVKVHMKVINHLKASWFLLKDQDKYYLDVNSGNSMVSYCITFELNSNEISSYLAQGQQFINAFSSRVNREQHPYTEREKALKSETSDLITIAIKDWNANNKP